MLVMGGARGVCDIGVLTPGGTGDTLHLLHPKPPSPLLMGLGVMAPGDQTGLGEGLFSQEPPDTLHHSS